MTIGKSDVYHLLPMCRMYGDVIKCTVLRQRKILGFGMFLTLFFGCLVAPDDPGIYLKVQLRKSSTVFV